MCPLYPAACALLTLAAMDHQKAWSNGHLKKVIQTQGLDRRDAALATVLGAGLLPAERAETLRLLAAWPEVSLREEPPEERAE